LLAKGKSCSGFLGSRTVSRIFARLKTALVGAWVFSFALRLIFNTGFVAGMWFQL